MNKCRVVGQCGHGLNDLNTGVSGYVERQDINEREEFRGCVIISSMNCQMLMIYYPSTSNFTFMLLVTFLARAISTDYFFKDIYWSEIN